jgi:hypothetical protein
VSTAFAAVRAEDDRLHLAPAGAPASLTETSYFGFNVPERNLNGEVYVWFHPALRVVSAGVLVWSGSSARRCGEHSTTAYLPWRREPDDLVLANGLRIRTEKPLERWSCEWQDAARNTSLRLASSALMPPAAPVRGGHLVQAVRTRGELVLRGEAIPIDGFFTRDRSWGAPRPEDPHPIPPLGWMAACSAPTSPPREWLRRPALGPAWAGGTIPRPGQTFACYVFRGGRTFAITRWRLTERARRHRARAAPRDRRLGRPHPCDRGEITSCLPWHTWPNVLTYFCQTRWTWNDRRPRRRPRHRPIARRFGRAEGCGDAEG